MKWRRLGYLAVFLGSCLFAVMRIIKVNTAFPKPESNCYSMQEQLSLPNQPQLFFTVEKMALLDQKAIAQEYPAVYQEKIRAFPDFAIFLVTITIANPETASQSFDLSEAMLTINGTYSNGIDYQTTKVVNGAAILDEVAGRQRVEITYAYTVVKENFARANWEQLGKQEIFFVYQLYPTIEKVRLVNM